MSAPEAGRELQGLSSFFTCCSELLATGGLEREGPRKEGQREPAPCSRRESRATGAPSIPPSSQASAATTAWVGAQPALTAGPLPTVRSAVFDSMHGVKPQRSPLNAGIHRACRLLKLRMGLPRTRKVCAFHEESQMGQPWPLTTAIQAPGAGAGGGFRGFRLLRK